MLSITVQTMDKQTVVLVSCVAKKLDHPELAGALYISPWFRAARQYALATSDEWWILSAKYGLVHPRRQIEPYDQSLHTMSQNERFAWAINIVRILKGWVKPETHRIVLLAGNRYCRHLEPMLREMDYELHRPLRGLPIGKQVQWLKKNGFPPARE